MFIKHIHNCSNKIDHLASINFIFLSLSRVVCKCGSCGMEKQSLTEWERHTGSKGKNWKTSVRVKGSMLSLEQWVRVPLIFLLLILYQSLS